MKSKINKTDGVMFANKLGVNRVNGAPNDKDAVLSTETESASISRLEGDLRESWHRKGETE